MWYCAFCNEQNEVNAENCRACGAHRTVNTSVDDARKLSPDIPERIAGLRLWVFIPALLIFGMCGLSYRQYVRAQGIVSQYRADCANLSTTNLAAACTGTPAAYKILASSGPFGSRVVEITPVGQTPFDLTGNPSSLPQSGTGTAIFWKGKLTALTTSTGQMETNFSPVHLVADQRAPIFCWFLIGFGALMLPITRGYALIFEPDVDDEFKPKRRVSSPKRK